jgi:hypothetical protein
MEFMVVRAEVGNEEDMKKSARENFGKELQDLYVEDVQGELVVKNRRGLSLAGLPREVALLRQEVASQNQEIASQSREIAAQSVNISSLRNRVDGLTCSLDAYKTLRNRFMSTFKRDKLNIRTTIDKAIIDEGNNWAHGGDAVVDAQLYEGPSGRKDYTTYEKLYGLPPETVVVVLRICKYSSYAYVLESFSKCQG